MNGKHFIDEIKRQVEAIKYLGECMTGFGTTFKMYLEAETRMSKFLHDNYLNLVACYDCIDIINDNWYASEMIVTSLIEAFEVGAYDETISTLTLNNTIWKHRIKLSKIDINIVR